jgi:two-component system chemotaxis sensor kinase CheA
MVRVDFAQLDHLLNLVGELVVYRTKLQEVGKEAAALLPGQEASRTLLDTVHQIAGVSTQLQETIMDIRMLPMRHVFERFPRLVRDLARQQGKEIELILEGEETRVDKAIIDEVGEPLVHMIRNSVDHGIETPDRRVARGKTATGTILLSAAQESNQVVITIMDDGAGIDVAQVRAKAVARGLIKADEILSDREVVQLIFAEGLSTAESVPDLSGGGGPGRGGQVHRAPERPGGGGDRPRSGYQVHHPAPLDPGHHLRAHGGGGWAHLRNPSGLGGGEPQVPARGRHPHERP